jgi:hypothetical protein
MTFQPESFCIEPAFRLDNSLRRFCIPRVVVDEIDDLDWLVIFWLVIFEMPARHVGLPGPVGQVRLEANFQLERGRLWGWVTKPRRRSARWMVESAGAGLTSRFGAGRRNRLRTGVPQMLTHRVPETTEPQTAVGARRLPRKVVFLESEGHMPSSKRIALNLATSGSCLHASEIPSARPCCPRRSALVRTFRSAPEFPRTWREGHGRPLDVESRSRT